MLSIRKWTCCVRYIYNSFVLETHTDRIAWKIEWKRKEMHRRYTEKATLHQWWTLFLSSGRVFFVRFVFIDFTFFDYAFAHLVNRVCAFHRLIWINRAIFILFTFEAKRPNAPSRILYVIGFLPLGHNTIEIGTIKRIECRSQFGARGNK